jgi:hypothetical protein
MSRKFELVGRIAFDAADIQDAYLKLAEHFTAFAHGHDSALMLPESSVKIRPVSLSGGSGSYSILLDSAVKKE